VALVVTARQSAISGNPHGTSGYTTAAFTPSNASLLVVQVGGQTAGGSGDIGAAFTISDTAGLTWTPRANAAMTGSFATGTRQWTAPVTTGVSMTVTVDCGANDIAQYLVSIVDVTGYDTGTPVGATVQDTSVASDGADTITLSAGTAASSVVVGGRCGGPTGTGTILAAAGSAHTEVHDLNATSALGLHTQVCDLGATSTAFSWTDTANGTGVCDHACVGVAIEVKAAATSSTIEGEASGLFGGEFTASGGVVGLPVALRGVVRSGLRF